MTIETPRHQRSSTGRLVVYLSAAGLAFFFDSQVFEVPQASSSADYQFVDRRDRGVPGLGWWISGRTPGKQVVGLRVVDVGGRSVGLGRSIARAVACVLSLWVPLDCL